MLMLAAEANDRREKVEAERQGDKEYEGRYAVSGIDVGARGQRRGCRQQRDSGEGEQFFQA